VACGDGDPDVPTGELGVPPVVVVPLFVLAVLAFCPLVAVLVPLPDEFDAEFSLSGLGVGSGGEPLARLVARIPDAIASPGITLDSRASSENRLRLGELSSRRRPPRRERRSG